MSVLKKPPITQIEPFSLSPVSIPSCYKPDGCNLFGTDLSADSERLKTDIVLAKILKQNLNRRLG